MEDWRRGSHPRVAMHLLNRSGTGRRLRQLLLLVVVGCLLAGNPTAFAQQDSCLRLDIASHERHSELFSLLYSNSDIDLGNTLLTRFGETLLADYERFSQLFGETLPVPIVIRIYPDREYFSCVNPLTPPPAGLTFHGHAGVKEIVLIGEDINVLAADWEELTLNALRHEMAVLFVEQITDGKAPPGLVTGIGVYAQDPAVTVTGRRTFAEADARPQDSWRELWEAQSNAGPSAFKAMTTVSYLVEVYGWPRFNDFLHQLDTAESYRQALHETYGLELAALQAPWQEYYPLFMAGRWRTNVFYGFDFTDLETLVHEGAYNDAITNLRDVISFLETVEDEERIAYAESLLRTAETGRDAGLLVRQARQALQEQDYARAIALADQAEEAYRSLGDERRLEELAGYRARAQAVLSLQQQLGTLASAITAGDEREVTITNLQKVHQELGRYGEAAGVSEAEELVELINTRKSVQAQQRLAAWARAIALVLLLRLVLVRLRAPRETKLV